MDVEGIKSKLEEYFVVYNVEEIPDGIRFYLHPRNPIDKDLRVFLASLANEYSVELKQIYGELVLELRKAREDRIWINVALLIATFCSTTLMGSMMYEKFDLMGGILFSLSIMFVLGSHEMGHYFAARRWKMRTSLPYFIPFPTIVGTLGAIIKHKGPIPNRKALFDVGVSGPLVGIVASIIVILVGLSMRFEPKAVGESMLVLGTPPLFELLVRIAGYDSQFIHPVAFAGWVGLFVTFLNLIPVGQLDGGHILRAMIGKKAEIVSRAMPTVLIGIGLLMGYIYNAPNSIWIFWGLIALFFSMHPHPEPIDDETPLDLKRQLIGVLTFMLAVMCFTPVPFQIVSNV
jgi:membrane-associated protease RseP (regulator of RpoE activity)